MHSDNRNPKTRYLVQLSVLTAILLLLEVTGLGFIKISVVEFTVMQIPVIIGAIVLGPATGAILGGVFGLLSFWECFGKSAFGAALLSIHPIYTFILCFVGRILMGWLCGLLFRLFSRGERQGSWTYFAASLGGAVLNTAFFMGLLIMLFGSTPYLIAMRSGASVLAFLAGLVGVQGLVEAAVCCLVGGAVSRALTKATQT